ncbi:hypothetical protein SAMN05216483_6467 [Streptomyces sp. 2131.1]|uniref:hypothetical protein n=1 Tax=Streptomyces sp. 2131.1 TaxID=1855346 RepID=UPI00089A5870|nr:hypothetical protein [Streptomyces sp. 2131.1]SEE51327.1 hypothetical protein SAMN05216483_6467 [Streptomyces sp. 2131.1]
MSARRPNSGRRSGKRSARRVRGCGTKFTDERWETTQATDWGTPADTHPTLCDRCQRRALVAVQLAQTLQHRSERHDQEDHQEDGAGAEAPPLVLTSARLRGGRRRSPVTYDFFQRSEEGDDLSSARQVP